MKFSIGDRVMIRIQDPDDYDVEYDGETGVVVESQRDALGKLTGKSLDSEMYTVELDDEETTFPARGPDLVQVGGDSQQLIPREAWQLIDRLQGAVNHLNDPAEPVDAADRQHYDNLCDEAQDYLIRSEDFVAGGSPGGSEG